MLKQKAQNILLTTTLVIASLVVSEMVFQMVTYKLGEYLHNQIYLPSIVKVTRPPLAELPPIARIHRIWGENAEMAISIAKAESGLRCGAVSPTNDYSIFQLNIVHSWRGDITDCTENIKIAKQIFDEQGWRPWVAYQNGEYKQFLIN